MSTPADSAADTAEAYAALKFLFDDYEPPLAFALQISAPLRPMLEILVQRVEAAWPGTCGEIMQVWVATSQESTAGRMFQMTLDIFLWQRWLSLTPIDRARAEVCFRETRRNVFRLLPKIVDDPVLLGLEITDPAGPTESPGRALRTRLKKEPNAAKRLQQRYLERLGERPREDVIDAVFELPDTLRKASRVLSEDSTLGELWSRATKIAAGRAKRHAEAIDDPLGEPQRPGGFVDLMFIDAVARPPQDLREVGVSHVGESTETARGSKSSVYKGLYEFSFRAEKGYELQVDPKYAEYRSYRKDWLNGDQEPAALFVVGGLFPAGFMKVDCVHPYLWVYLKGERETRIRRAEALRTGVTVRAVSTILRQPG